MKGITTATIVIVVAAAAASAGYWWGTSKSARIGAASEQVGANAERKILYYRNPMVSADTSPAPKKTPDGMDYVPVYADEAATEADKPTGKILYYRNPMGLPDTSPVPKKDPMGMDYMPVYEGEEPASDGPVVKISVDKVQKLGVRTEAAAPRELTRTVRAVATIQADERRLHTVAPKFEGWIQKLYVNTTGQLVRRGEALMDVYSPDLITAQQEYLIAWKGDANGQGRQSRSSGQHAATRGQRLAAAAQLGHFGNRTAALAARKQSPAIPDAALPGERGRAGEAIHPGKAFHGGGGAVRDRRPVERMDASGRVRAGSRDGASGAVGNDHG